MTACIAAAVFAVCITLYKVGKDYYC